MFKKIWQLVKKYREAYKELYTQHSDLPCCIY